MKRLCTVLVVLLLSIPPIGTTAAIPSRSTTYFVDADSSGGSGSSWGTAFQNIQQALAVAASGDQIWVAEGVYYPDEGPTQTDNSRSESFILIDGVALYGGFAGTESQLSERDWTTYVTVLSGDIDKNDTTNSAGVVEAVADITGSNAYNVVRGTSLGSTTLLDGFTITAGYADSNICPGQGCGGGALFYSSAAPTLENLSFSANFANYYGGGLVNHGSTGTTLTGITFIANQALPAIFVGVGGGAYFAGSTLTLSNITFEANAATYGGGLATKDASITLSNGTFEDNTAQQGGGLFAEPETPNSTGSLSLTDVSFTENHANIPTITSGVQTCNGGGGLCYFGSGDLTLTRVTFTENDTLGMGGGLYVDNLGTSLLTDVDFSANTCNYNGGGLGATNGTLTIDGADFENNQAGIDGGGLAFTTGTLQISNSTFTGNTGRLGGGLILSEVSAAGLSSITFSSNAATTSGGGIFAGWDTALTISDAAFSDNTATYGGGLYSDTSQTLTITRATFTRNHASAGSGGGVYTTSRTAMTDVSFYGNKSTFGSGLSNLGVEFSLENGVFVGNTSTFGAGIYTAINDSNTFSVVNATFAYNEATWGDGLYSEIVGGSTPDALNALIANSIFWGSDNQLTHLFATPVTRNCAIEDGFSDGTAIMNRDPLFTRDPDPGSDGLWGTLDDDYGDVTPMDYSPVIHAGNTADCTLSTDLAGLPRMVGPAVDLGAYEVQNPYFRKLLPAIMK
jgi:predicted outer membrane repeat protein